LVNLGAKVAEVGGQCLCFLLRRSEFDSR